MIECGWHLSPNRALALDPVNLLFYGDATAQTVASILLDSDEYDWRPSSLSGVMYAFIGDDTDQNLSSQWKEADQDLALGPATGQPAFIFVFTIA